MQTFKNALTKRDDRGFTLIELLVVIAIIAVLAALILAALSSAQKGARDARRQSDLNQYKTALAQYQSDNGGTYPGGAVTPATVSTSNICGATALVSTYISQCLNDPKNTGTNVYSYGSGNGSNFAVCAPLERSSDWQVVGPTYSGKGSAHSPAISSVATCTDAS